MQVQSLLASIGILIGLQAVKRTVAAVAADAAPITNDPADCRTIKTTKALVFHNKNGKASDDWRVEDRVVYGDQSRWLELAMTNGTLLVDPKTKAFDSAGSCRTFDRWTGYHEADAPGGFNNARLVSFHDEVSLGTQTVGMEIGMWYNTQDWYAVCYAKLTPTLKDYSEYADCTGTVVPRVP